MCSRAWFELLKMCKRQVKFFFIKVVEITGVCTVNDEKYFLCVMEMLKLAGATEIQHNFCGRNNIPHNKAVQQKGSPIKKSGIAHRYITCT